MKKKKPEVIKLVAKIEDPVFQSNVHVYEGLTQIDFCNFARKAYDVDLIGSTGIAATWALTKIGEGCTSLVWFSKYDICSTVIAHELLHAVFNALRHIGISLSESSEEAYTYLFGFYLGELYDKTCKG